MDPWGNAAAQYNQGLGQLAQINQQGYQAQAQGPASIYDRFLQGYVQAKQMRMQEAQMERENAYKLAHSAHLNAQTSDLFQKRQDAETAAKAQRDYDEAFRNAIDEKGNIDQAKLSGELSKRGQASYLPKAMKEVLVNEETKAKTLKERAASDKAAREHIASLAAIGLQGDPDGAIRTIKGLAESNPDLYGKHIGVLGMVDPQNPDAKKLALRSLYGQGVEAKDLAPKAEIKEVGGKTSVYNVGNPLLGGVSKTQDLGYNPQSVVGKAQADINAGAIDPSTGAALIKKETTVQPTMGTVLLKQMEGAGNKEGTEPLDPGEEVIAKAIARREQNLMEPNARNASLAKRVNARAAYLAGQGGAEVGGKASVAEQQAGMVEFSPKGAQGKTLISIDTATGHLKQLDRTIAALNNGDVKAINEAKNFFKNQFGIADVSNFETVKSVVIPEVLKVAKGNGVINEQEEKRLTAIANSAGSFDQLSGFTREYKKIMGSRIEAINPVYQRYFPGKSVAERLRPETVSMFKETGVDLGNGSTASAQGSGTAPSQETATRKWKQDPQTKKFGWRVFKNGKWEWE